MRKPNNSGRDKNKDVLKCQAREARVLALKREGTPEARKQLKQMNQIWTGSRVASNVRGMYAGRKGNGSHPVRIKINAKNRPCLGAMKQIMVNKG